jgi:hypothetical protein
LRSTFAVTSTSCSGVPIAVVFASSILYSAAMMSKRYSVPSSSALSANAACPELNAPVPITPHRALHAPVLLTLQPENCRQTALLRAGCMLPLHVATRQSPTLQSDGRRAVQHVFKVPVRATNSLICEYRGYWAYVLLVAVTLSVVACTSGTPEHGRRLSDTGMWTNIL